MITQAAPLAVGRREVFGHEDDLRRSADQLGLQRMRWRLDQGQQVGPSVGATATSR